MDAIERQNQNRQSQSFHHPNTTIGNKFVQMSDQQESQKQVADFYNREAETYDDRFDSASGKYIHERQASIVLDQLGDVDGKRILEIAAGTGRFTELLSQHGANVVVVDVARKMLEQNRARTSAAEFVQGSATELPIQEEAVDACVTVNALNHIPNQWKVLDEVYRVLSPRGSFVANYPNLYSNRLPIGLYVNYRNQNVGGGVYTKWFKISEAKSKLTDAGFDVTACVGDRLLPVKIASGITIPLSRLMERLIMSSPLANVSVSPFITATKE